MIRTRWNVLQVLGLGDFLLVVHGGEVLIGKRSGWHTWRCSSAPFPIFMIHDMVTLTRAREGGREEGTASSGRFSSFLTTVQKGTGSCFDLLA